jgi:RNA polymerase sigma-70 factor, ECF subfamily
MAEVAGSPSPASEPPPATVTIRPAVPGRSVGAAVAVAGGAVTNSFGNPPDADDATAERPGAELTAGVHPTMAMLATNVAAIGRRRCPLGPQERVGVMADPPLPTRASLVSGSSRGIRGAPRLGIRWPAQAFGFILRKRVIAVPQVAGSNLRGRSGHRTLQGPVTGGQVGELAAERVQVGASQNASLVARARAGDVAAFDELAAARVEGLYRTAVAILGIEADARDAVQEACVSAWRELPRLREADRFDAWLGRILLNSCRLVLRRRRRRSVREVAASTINDSGVVASQPTEGSFSERTASLDVLERAFERLSVDHRAVLVLHHLRGRSLDEIGRLLGIPTGTVKSRHHAARSALAAALEAEAR